MVLTFSLRVLALRLPILYINVLLNIDRNVLLSAILSFITNQMLYHWQPTSSDTTKVYIMCGDLNCNTSLTHLTIRKSIMLWVILHEFSSTQQYQNILLCFPQCLDDLGFSDSNTVFWEAHTNSSFNTHFKAAAQCLLLRFCWFVLLPRSLSWSTLLMIKINGASIV